MAPPAVILSASLFAYYGHIRASAGHVGFMFLCPPLLDPQKVPTLSAELDGVPPSLLRWLQ
ncbi:hypothetical protein SBV1_1520020 [Verrucomicrobia bacterium]|nr:hypothetical protein SBV1_1520020 [Verrucomicrobiota bacterium]